jgi:hypothetical protein
MEMTRSSLKDTREEVFVETESGSPQVTRVAWDPDAIDRLGRVPNFVRGMVKRIYTDWAKENGVATITPAVMDRARTELGLEGM